MWWNGLTPVDQNSQINIDKLVTLVEDTKLAEVHAWADALRRKDPLDDGSSEMVEATLGLTDKPMFEEN
jgi:hypothetical protein